MREWQKSVTLSSYFKNGSIKKIHFETRNCPTQVWGYALKIDSDFGLSDLLGV
jgi:hypothetical protein